MVLWLSSSVGMPNRQISVTPIFGGRSIVLLEFWDRRSLMGNVCFTHRPKDMYDALTKVLDKDWDGEMVEFEELLLIGTINRYVETIVNLTISVPTPKGPIFQARVDLRDINSLRNKLAGLGH